MSKAKPGSAAQRREQVRQQRDQRLHTKQAEQGRKGGSRRRPAKNNPWPIIGGLVAVVAIVVGIFFFLSHQQTAQDAAGTATAQKALTTIDAKTLSAVGPGSAQSSMHAVSGAAILKGSNGKPEILYVGGEYCPYCAAQRWGVINALSRFGTFGTLEGITSSESNVPTFTFHNATYTSQYIDFVGRETDGQQQGTPLDTLTSQEQQLFSKYDASPYTTSTGSIPFVDIGNQYVSSGAYYDPTILTSHSYQDIATQLKDPNSDIAKGVLGTANYLTAAICAITNNQPTNVCTTDPIPSLQSNLPKAAFSTSNSQLAAAALPAVADIRRQD